VTRRTSRLRVGAAVLGTILAAWLALGLLRAGGEARSYFANAHGIGATVVNVTVDSVAPAVPPFWVVSIGGDIIESGASRPAYRSVMLLWIEPLTGWVIVVGAG